MTNEPSTEDDDGLVAGEGVNETAAEDSPGGSISGPDSDSPDVEPNEPG